MTFAPLLCGLAFGWTPRFLDRDRPLSVVPLQVAFDSGKLVFMTGVVRVVQGKLFQGGEVAFDAVQPGGVGRREDQPDIVAPGPRENLGLR